MGAPVRENDTQMAMPNLGEKTICIFGSILADHVPKNGS
jgi:hypothetical protein